MTRIIPHKASDLQTTGERVLWTEVLSVAINDALTGNGLTGKPDQRIEAIVKTRTYLTKPNRDFDLVCNLAGLDPVAVREAITKQLANAQTPEALINQRRSKRGRLPRIKTLEENDLDQAA